MKLARIILIITAIIFIGSSTSKAQTPSCSELISYVTSEGGYPSIVNCVGSSWLLKVERYEIDGNGVAVVWVKRNDYDSIGKPYVYCGITDTIWRDFGLEGVISSSWGKAFHQYIKGNNCNCN
jgi:hypothetical protein